VEELLSRMPPSSKLLNDSVFLTRIGNEVLLDRFLNPLLNEGTEVFLAESFKLLDSLWNATPAPGTDYTLNQAPRPRQAAGAVPTPVTVSQKASITKPLTVKNSFSRLIVQPNMYLLRSMPLPSAESMGQVWSSLNSRLRKIIPYQTLAGFFGGNSKKKT
jgi:hypothetical protein